MTGHTTTAEHLTSTRGTSLALHRFGGSGPTLMVNHATGFHANCYLPMMATLTKSFSVWGVDFAAHGRSEGPPDDDFRWTLFAQDLLDAIDHIGESSVFAFGHSMGATAALLAEKARPGVIEAAWLYEPIVFPPDLVPRNSQMAEASLHRRREFDSKPHALARYASRPPLGTLRADALFNYVEHGFTETDEGTVTLACAPEHEAATFNNAGTAIEDIAAQTMRAAIACGRVEKSPGPAEWAAPTAQALAHGELVTYRGLGHFGPLQDPDLIAADVVQFLTS